MFETENLSEEFLQKDKLHDECGVVGIFLGEESLASYSPPPATFAQQNVGKHACVRLTLPLVSSKAANLSYFALYALQHRGQESAGIAASDGEKIRIHKQMGLVSEVFNPQELANLKGHIAVGHVRYATAGGKTVENAQPMVNNFILGTLALAHNGQLTNYGELEESLALNGSTFSSSSDTEVILKLIARDYKAGLEQAVKNAVQQIKGSFALTIMTKDTLIGVRDPNGIRPLVLGKIDNGYILASETCAIDAVNGTYERDIAPGEIIIITKEGIKSILPGEEGYDKLPHAPKKTCIFEYVYFARPDSVIDGIAVQQARERMGAELAREDTVEADVVIGVPDSGIGAALGYSREKKIPYVMGIVKNKYTGRTFIAPTQQERENMVFVKLNAIKSDLEGKRVIVIDDSIVRGTTSRRLVHILRRAGAKEVHFRVSSPPVKFPCHLGIDTPTKAELISSAHEVQEICQEIGADSLTFISLKGMLNALGSSSFCQGCFNGEYPA